MSGDIEFKTKHELPEDNGRQRRFYENIVQSTQRDLHEKLIAEGLVPLGDDAMFGDTYVTKEEKAKWDATSCDFAEIEKRYLALTFKSVIFRGRKRSANGWMTFVKTLTNLDVRTVFDLKDQFPGVRITSIYGDGVEVFSND